MSEYKPKYAPGFEDEAQLNARAVQEYVAALFKENKTPENRGRSLDMEIVVGLRAFEVSSMAEIKSQFLFKCQINNTFDSALLGGVVGSVPGLFVRQRKGESKEKMSRRGFIYGFTGFAGVGVAGAVIGYTGKPLGDDVESEAFFKDADSIVLSELRQEMKDLIMKSVRDEQLAIRALYGLTDPNVHVTEGFYLPGIIQSYCERYYWRRLLEMLKNRE